MRDPIPHLLGDETRHYWLAVSMARKTGAAMQRALDESMISHADWAAVVLRCRGCGWADECDRWLSVQHDRAAEVPAICASAQVFNRVRQAGAPT
ncbi:DUF6455 family protein [Roseicyclus marinus]|uniref:DUF6455 family protein n=1 Tax=Roseicyclus marinus TaxID=2161673 RepID=UPI00240ECDCA|nr:DUF6455 family protein [Roseicyclus marinus]MDG3042066.1 DUF6455 family protein [Roseicyclus marinus]